MEINSNSSLENKDIIVGIDLGTSNSCAALWENKQLQLIKDERGNTSVPSIVAFDNKGTLIGYDAKLQQRKNPQNTFTNVKRFIGRNYSDPKVQENIKYLPFRISSTEDDNILIHTKGINNKKPSYRPEEISAMVLMKLKKIINNHFKNKAKYDNFQISKVIVTIPAYFNDSQKQATKDAVTIAGLECVRLINEPTAAALAYGLNNNCNDIDRNVIVYDFGGGTLDVSLLNIDNGTFNVIGTQGDSHLGGNDFDNYLLKYTLGEIIKSYPKINQTLLKKNIHKIKKSCEIAKIKLSKQKSTIIKIKSLLKDENDKFINFNLSLSREKFEELAEPLWKRCLDPVKKLIKITSSKVEEIDDIILVGGSTRIPYVKNMLSQYFGKKVNDEIDPDHVVAAGAAIQGYILSHTDDAFCRDLVLKDVIPLSLGIETANGVMTFIIPRNSSIPIKESQKFTTQEEEQESVTIKVFEGERRLTKDNFLVGTFILDKIEKAPKGIPVIVVSISVDVNGIVHVSAVDKKEGVSNSIRVTGNKRRLTSDEISSLIQDAKKWEKHDIYNQEIKELHIELDGLIEMITFNTDKNKEVKLKKKDVVQIKIDLKKYQKWFQELIEIEEEMEDMEEEIDLSIFQRRIKQIKKKYAPLVIGMDNVEKSGGVKSFNYKNNSYDQDGNRFDDEGQDYGDLKMDEEVDQEVLQGEDGTQFLGEKTQKLRRNPDAWKDIKERNKLVDICDNIQHAIQVKKLKLLSHNREKLLNYMDEIRIWMNVNINLTPLDYTRKIKELAQASQTIILENKKEMEEKSEGNKKKISKKDKKKKNYRQELLDLCQFLSRAENLSQMGINRKSQSIIQRMSQKAGYWVEVKGRSLPDDSQVIKEKIKEINMECERIKRFNDRLQQSSSGSNQDI